MEFVKNPHLAEIFGYWNRHYIRQSRNIRNCPKITSHFICHPHFWHLRKWNLTGYLCIYDIYRCMDFVHQRSLSFMGPGIIVAAANGFRKGISLCIIMYPYVSLLNGLYSQFLAYVISTKKTQMSTSSFTRLNLDSKWLAILNYWECLKQRAPQNACFCGSWTDISNISSCKRKSWGSGISSFHHYTCWITWLVTSTPRITIHTCNSMRALNGTSVSDIKSGFMVTKREHKAWMCKKSGSLKTNNSFLRKLSNTHRLHWILAGPQILIHKHHLSHGQRWSSRPVRRRIPFTGYMSYSLNWDTPKWMVKNGKPY